ncbi:BrnA antitoxin family protein [Aerosakkonema funiforme]|uniref:BrnA antitoxin family protein n=1 Tax=Aerosakkonema funiforme TaxID=1246630 RepID=UPI0035B7D1DC
MKEEYDFRQGKRGAIDPIPPGKTRITIRLDDDILVWFRAEVNAAGGGNYQTLINNALREYIQQRKEPWEDTLRRVLREEL